MIGEIVTMLNCLVNTNQLLKTMVNDPLIPSDQKQIIRQRIDANDEATRKVRESEVVKCS